MNKQPSRIFRRAQVWDLPDGHWQAVQAHTHHGADAFLLSSGSDRLLLAPRGKGRYRAAGRGDFFIEDGRMQRFEIVSSADCIYAYSALAEQGRIKLLPQERSNKILTVIPHRNGGFSFIWISDDDNTNKKTIFCSRVSERDLRDTPADTFLSSGNRSEIIQLDSPMQPFIKSANDYLVCWLTGSEEGLLPRFCLHVPSSTDGSSLFRKTRFLSYNPLPEGSHLVGIWQDPLVRALFQTPDGDVMYYEESRERGGEGFRSKLLEGVRDIRVVPGGWLAWRYNRELFLGKISEKGVLDTISFMTEKMPERIDYEIVFDDDDKPHLLLLEESDETVLRTVPLAGGLARELFVDEKRGWRLHVSRCVKGLARGAMLLHQQEAVTFLPVNPSLPLDDDDSVKENMNQRQPIPFGPGYRPWLMRGLHE